MNSIPLFKKIILPALILVGLSLTAQQKQSSVLIFSKTNGYRHQSIPAGIAAIKKLRKTAIIGDVLSPTGEIWEAS